jgi:hypothetical protein
VSTTRQKSWAGLFLIFSVRNLLARGVAQPSEKRKAVAKTTVAARWARKQKFLNQSKKSGFRAAFRPAKDPFAPRHDPEF